MANGLFLGDAPPLFEALVGDEGDPKDTSAGDMLSNELESFRLRTDDCSDCGAFTGDEDTLCEFVLLWMVSRLTPTPPPPPPPVLPLWSISLRSFSF